MKIEKLTENKIRIILHQEDFIDKSTNIHNLLLQIPDSSSLLLEILNKAQKEVGFDTDGYKLLIETSYTGDDTCVFTITKYNSINSNSFSKASKKYLTIKRKNTHLQNTNIYSFNTFEDFCNFCNSINRTKLLSLKGLFKNCILYSYLDTYYLFIDNLNNSSTELKIFTNIITEFSTKVNYSKNFEAKLKEYGNLIIKNNAIKTGIKYFCK